MTYVLNQPPPGTAMQWTTMEDEPRAIMERHERRLRRIARIHLLMWVAIAAAVLGPYLVRAVWR